MRTTVALVTAVVLLLVPAEAPAKVRSCHTRADFNLLISSARNMRCKHRAARPAPPRRLDQLPLPHARRLQLQARVRQRARGPVAVREAAQGLPLRVQRLMARRRKRSRFEFGGDLEGLLERPDPQTEKAQAEDEKTQDGHPAPSTAGAGGPHERLLELQKTAGNRAVGAVLDRLAHDAAHAAPAGGGGWPKEKQIIFDGTGMPLESVNLGVVGAPHPGGGTRTPKPDEFGGPGEISVVLPDGGWLNDLVPRPSGAASPTRGRDRLPAAGGGGLRLILTAVADLELREQRRRRPIPLATLTLKFKKRTLSQDPPPGASRSPARRRSPTSRPRRRAPRRRRRARSGRRCGRGSSGRGETAIDRAVVALERVLERLDRVDVEVVGRLVEHEAVRARPASGSRNASRVRSPPLSVRDRAADLLVVEQEAPSAAAPRPPRPASGRRAARRSPVASRGSAPAAWER